jgi:beta-phosphoglucomutase-like phosphatase (HAD superfamily)
MERRYQVVLLDMDGTFLDSRGKGKIPNEWAYNALKKTLGHYDVALTIEEIDRLFLAPLRIEGAAGVEQFCARFGLDCEEFWARREKDVIEAKIEAMRRGTIKLCASSKEIIRYLSAKFQLAVVSDSQQACVDYTLDRFNLKRYFTVWYGRKSDLASLARRKPNPFYIQKVLRDLQLQQEGAILADDSPAGVLAAHRAGIDSVLIARDAETRTKCEAEPTYVVMDIGDLRRVL